MPDRTWQPSAQAKTPAEVNNVQQQRDRGNIRYENYSHATPPPSPQRAQPQPQPQQQPQRPQTIPQQRPAGNGEDKHRPR